MPSTRRLTFVLFLALLTLAASPAAARADELRAGGVSIAGKVKSLTAKGVEFQPDFAKSAMLVEWEKIDELRTESRYQILYAEDLEVTAPISEMEDGKLVAGDVEIDPATLVAATVVSAESPGFLERTRSSWRYWHGGFDVGFNLQRATVDNLGALVALRALRSKGPTRLILGADYRYANERDPKSPPPRKRTTKDAAAALVRGEYDLSKHVFLFASGDALYDSIQNLSLRAVPKAGAGYVLWERAPKEGVRDFVQVEAGAGWVYEKYIHNGTPPDPVVGEDDYFTVALGAAAGVLLPRGMLFDWRFDYLPSVTDFADDYVVRTTAGLTIPLIAPLSARLAIADTYDNTPSGGAEKNSLLFDTTLSVIW
jgi:hypothetical protein